MNPLEQPYIVIFGAALRRDGSPSGAMRDRVGAAVRFSRRVLPAPIFIVTGGRRRNGPAEAEVMADLLMARGVQPSQIRLEPLSRNTLRSAIAVGRMLRGELGPVYAATSGYHMIRCVLLLGLTGLDAHRSPPALGPAASNPARRWWWRVRELPAIPVDCMLMAFYQLFGGSRRAATKLP